MQIAELDQTGAARELEALAEILHACVHGGASVSFMLPFAMEEARAFWRRVIPLIGPSRRRLLVARVDGRTLGTAQIDMALPPNQPHRAEVMKVLVHPDGRRRGLARALMLELERLAHAERRTLLTLDTLTGSAGEQLYGAIGYRLAGVIPGYALSTAGRPEATSFMYKALD